MTVASTSTTLTSSAASAVYGQSVTFTATVAGPAVPTGTVAFYAGAVTPADQIGTGTLSVDERPRRGHIQHVDRCRSAAVRTRSRPSMAAMPTTWAAHRTSSTRRSPRPARLIVVTPYNVTDDGNPHTATGTATGVESPNPANLSSLLDLSGTTHTSPGSYTDTWTFAGNANYNSASGTITDVIAQPAPDRQPSIAAVSPNPRNTPVSSDRRHLQRADRAEQPDRGAVTLTDNGTPSRSAASRSPSSRARPRRTRSAIFQRLPPRKELTPSRSTPPTSRIRYGTWVPDRCRRPGRLAERRRRSRGPIRRASSTARH